MKTVLKVLVAIAGALIALAVVAAIAVALLFDPKTYQPLLAESVEKATGRKLTLEGDLGLSFFPCCAVTLERAALGNPPGFPQGDFASVQSAALSLKVWPLIVRREVEIGTVRLEGLDASLLVRADGAANWTFETAEAQPPPSAEPEAPATAQKFAIEGVQVRGGRISYRDEQAKADYLAEDLELVTGDLRPGQPFDLKLAAKLTDRSDGTSGTVALQARAAVDPDFERITLATPRFDMAAAGKAIPAKSLKVSVRASELAIEVKQDTALQFRGLQTEFELPGLEAAAGDLAGRLDAGDAKLVAGASTELLLPGLDGDVTLRGKDVPGEKVSARVKTGKVSLDIDKARGSVESLAADIDGLGAKVVLTAAGRFAERDTELAGTLKLEPLSPRSLLVLLKQPVPETADAQALTRLSGSADWALASDSLQLSKLDLLLDQTRARGSLGINDFDKPFTRFDLNLDAIDLDRYLAPESASASGQGGSAAAAEEDISVETIRELRLDGRLAAGAMTVAKVSLADVSATVRANDGRLRLAPLAARLYGGEYRGAVTIDATGRVAKITLDQQLTALQVGPVLRDFFETDKLTGALTGRINATGAGNTTAAIVKTLAGNVALSLADGAYLGTDLWHEIRSARARIKGEAAPPVPGNPQTRLNALELAGNISDGVLRTDRLLAEIPFIRLSGAGALNLVDKTLDYRLQGQVFETPTFEDGAILRDLTGLAIPITLRGAMDKPKVGVDIKELATGVATQKLKERLIKKLGGDEPAAARPAPEGELAGEQPAAPAEPPKEEKPRDVLKRGLRDLLKNQ